MLKRFAWFSKLVQGVRRIARDCVSFAAGFWRRRAAFVAENLFLRKRLALFRERDKKAMPTTPADGLVFSKLAALFDWRNALMIVKPATLIGWHRTAFGLYWRRKSRPVGRPQVTAEVRELIRRLAAENGTRGQKQIANELSLKLQIHLSPKTIAKYIKQAPAPRTGRDQRWATFIRITPTPSWLVISSLLSPPRSACSTCSLRWRSGDGAWCTPM